ncbi:P-type conjugative transfer protein VirB9 [Brucella neotomae]|uniref:Type IV secretion system protein virB9 n=1 Tax=Brucella neotomae 5K33 TaxID=520456 RepID=A0A7U8K7M4_BRUNE|nr:P-type conjugative transfer protein VirB9 [Brucella neotomae]EEY03140.1 type IV secretion system protein virB9 [Brucella neotomae 5K33]KEX98452.1 type IV secretion protein VirB9 [Brucella neotomae 5K33]SPU71265.1 Type IV secretion system CagX conjugation protein [Brucella neotomae]SUW61153.1 Type IV secretion system CagX conjugation protein [Brucella neotomae]
MKRFLLACILITLASPSWATKIPSGSKYDSRIQYVDYNSGDVVLVRALPGVGARIVFAPGENIEDVASGFTQGWEFKASHNILYLKARSMTLSHSNQSIDMAPEPGKWDTNLMVTTDQRMYDFDLRLMPGRNNQRVAYRVQFRYPAAAAAAAVAAAQKRVVQARMNARPSPVNWNYTMQVGTNSASIAPTLAYDDGRFTYLRFPNNRDFPAAFLVAEDKSESIVNSHIDASAPDILVLHRVAKQMVLRLGNKVIGIYNESFNPDGVPARDGTTVPGVKRVIKSPGENLQ